MSLLIGIYSGDCWVPDSSFWPSYEIGMVCYPYHTDSKKVKAPTRRWLFWLSYFATYYPFNFRRNIAANIYDINSNTMKTVIEVEMNLIRQAIDTILNIVLKKLYFSYPYIWKYDSPNWCQKKSQGKKFTFWSIKSKLLMNTQ